MRYLDEYRSPAVVKGLLEQVKAEASKMKRKLSIMEVCGGQTHNLARFGIEQELAPWISMMHGPGCPVCVTPYSRIDAAVDLSLARGVHLFTFGDMVRVPGSRCSLLDAKAKGGRVHIVLSPMEAVDWACRHPHHTVVLFAIGFETTAPVNALALRQAERMGLQNFFLLAAQVRILPVLPGLLKGLASDGEAGLDGLLAAGHVCAVTGYEGYVSLAHDFEIPIVITGFEPVDLLRAILKSVRAAVSGKSGAWNEYPRVVRLEGNRRAQEIIQVVYDVCDAEWRGFGIVPAGGHALNERYAQYDAQSLLPASGQAEAVSPLCSGDRSSCAAVLSGRLSPRQCDDFAQACRPESPLGAPMVSDEGACLAWFRYRNALPAESEGRFIAW